MSRGFQLRSLNRVNWLSRSHGRIDIWSWSTISTGGGLFLKSRIIIILKTLSLIERWSVQSIFLSIIKPIIFHYTLICVSSSWFLKVIFILRYMWLLICLIFFFSSGRYSLSLLRYNYYRWSAVTRITTRCSLSYWLFIRYLIIVPRLRYGTCKLFSLLLYFTHLLYLHLSLP